MRAAAALLALFALAGPASAQLDGFPTTSRVEAHVDFEDVAGPEAIVRTPPVYPAMAATRLSEAACRFTFDVLPDGRTANLCGACKVDGGAAGKRYEDDFTMAGAAIYSWRYPESEQGFTGAETILTFEIVDRGRSDLPEPPAAVACAAEG